MPEWLTEALAGDALPPTSVLVTRTALAIALGVLVAGVYHVTHGRRADTRTLPATLVLLCVLIALVTVVIGNNVARAFGLVGALSIVRFRTVVEDTRDTAFVIFAVVVGMAVGAGYSLVAAVGIPAVALAAALMSWLDRSGRPTPELPPAWQLTVRLGLGQDPAAVLGAVLDRFTTSARVVAAGTVRQGAALEVTYAVRLRDPQSAATLVGELNRVEGVQGAELREQRG